jgi:hypothetical protein
LQAEEAGQSHELAPWQKQIVEERLKGYYGNPDNVSDFDETIASIKI